MSIELSENENNNYGVIISDYRLYPLNVIEHKTVEIDETTKNGVKYIYNNLIKPLQTNINSQFQHLKTRETSSRKLRGDQVKSDMELFKKMQKSADKTKYNLYALRMNDFDELLKGLITPTIFFNKILKIEKYLYKLFKFLNHINEKGIYYYQSTIIYDGGYEKVITELRNINYKYLIIVSNNNYQYIDFDIDLKNFEIFKTKLKIFDIENITVCVLAKCASSDLRQSILNYKPILIKNKSIYHKLIDGLKHLLAEHEDFKQDKLLYKYIINLNFFKLLKQSLFSYDRKLYYIKKNGIYYDTDDDNTNEDEEEDEEEDVGNFLKQEHNNILSFTYNINTTLNLHQQEMFLNDNS